MSACFRLAPQIPSGTHACLGAKILSGSSTSSRRVGLRVRDFGSAGDGHGGAAGGNRKERSAKLSSFA